MGRRIDFHDDPAAPAANSLVPSVNVVVTNPAGEILLIRRSDNQNWAVPGGAIDLGESMMQAAVRETKEETGVDCQITGLVGIYTDPKHVILYTSNGEVRQEFSIVLTARATGGAPRRSDESSEVRWVPRESLSGGRTPNRTAAPGFGMADGLQSNPMQCRLMGVTVMRRKGPVAQTFGSGVSDPK